MFTYQNYNQEIEEMLVREFSSLCTTCDHFTSCTFPDARKGVIQCEMFENSSDQKADLRTMFIQSMDKITHPEAKGICSNCSNFISCKLPRDPAGVWHCEEYK